MATVVNRYTKNPSWQVRWRTSNEDGPEWQAATFYSEVDAHRAKALAEEHQHRITDVELYRLMEQEGRRTAYRGAPLPTLEVTEAAVPYTRVTKTGKVEGVVRLPGGRNRTRTLPTEAEAIAWAVEVRTRVEAGSRIAERIREVEADITGLLKDTGTAANVRRAAELTVLRDGMAEAWMLVTGEPWAVRVSGRTAA